MKRYNDVRTTSYSGPERDCCVGTCSVIARVVLRYNYTTSDGRTEWATRHYCGNHAERWLDKHVRQGQLFPT